MQSINKLINQTTELLNETYPIKNLDQILPIAKLCSEASSNISIISEGYKIPYGRYLVHKDKLFNIQVDVFSSNYIGRTHNHKTWGCLGVISGKLIVHDYQMSNDKLVKIRSGVLSKGSTSSFLKDSDWHSTETTSIDGQEISFHIYGDEFDLDQGFYYEDNTGIVHHSRGELKYFDSIKEYFRDAY